MKSYKVTIENLQSIFNYLEIEADMKDINGELIITTNAGHGTFTTALPSVK